MKTTYHTTGFLADKAYSSGLPLFLEQYTDRFPGLNYLHLSLEQEVNSSTTQEEPCHYYGGGKCLKIRLAKENSDRLPTPFEIYEELRLVFDMAVEHHLDSQLHEFSAECYL